ncbi:ATP-binding protein [Kitasatospora kazusensis]|uniref:ATP-binding protein n=1 Tax=Kitasatospora kazusensis TaxID=407974 RepID=UPI0031D58719
MPHGPASVSVARRQLRRDLGEREMPDAVVDDAVLILSELLSNSCRYARPLALLAELDERDTVLVGAHAPARRGALCPEADRECGGLLVRWQLFGDGSLTLEVTDGGAVTRPLPARPSLTSRGGRGLSIVGKLATAWGVRDAPGQVTVWAALRPERAERSERSERLEHADQGARSA